MQEPRCTKWNVGHVSMHGNCQIEHRVEPMRRVRREDILEVMGAAARSVEVEHCGITVGSLWDQCGVIAVGSRWDHGGIAVGSQ